MFQEERQQWNNPLQVRQFLYVSFGPSDFSVWTSQWKVFIKVLNPIKRWCFGLDTSDIQSCNILGGTLVGLQLIIKHIQTLCKICQLKVIKLPFMLNWIFHILNFIRFQIEGFLTRITFSFLCLAELSLGLRSESQCVSKVAGFYLRHSF